MKQLLALIYSAAMWYGITSFIVWNTNIQTWHWLARALFIVFTILTIEKALKYLDKI